MAKELLDEIKKNLGVEEDNKDKKEKKNVGERETDSKFQKVVVSNPARW